MSTVSGGRQPTPALRPSRPAAPPQMRTAADAAGWLRQCAAEFLTQAHDESSPIHATALRKAGATVDALAVAMDRRARDDTAAADVLLHLARDYRQTQLADLRDPDFEDYQMVCGHVADTLTDVGTQLRRAVAAERTRHARPVSHSHVTQRNL